MHRAQCACGGLRVTIGETAPQVVACHCRACQRRSGSVFGVSAYVPAAETVIEGTAKEYARPTDSGGLFRQFFCPDCGSTVFWRTDKHPAMLGIAAGAFADPDFPPPVRSVWKETRHRWVSIDVATQHFPKGRTG
jgi:hypothetical protein